MCYLFRLDHLTCGDITSHNLDQDILIVDAQIVAAQHVNKVLVLKLDHLLDGFLTAINDLAEAVHDDLGTGFHDALVMVLHYVIVVLQNSLIVQ